MGYAVVEFDGTTENVKLVIKDAQGLESSGGKIEDVIKEGTLESLRDGA